MRNEWEEKLQAFEQAEIESERTRRIIGKLQGGEISDVEAAAELWPNSPLAKAYGRSKKR